MCSTGPFQYRWLKRYIYSSCYYHHQIGSIHLSHCYHIFLWLCVWDVCYIIVCYLLHTHSRKTGNLFSFLLCSLWWVQIMEYVLFWRSYSFLCTLHHLFIIIVQNLSEDIELIKCLSDIFCRVCKIRHILCLHSLNYPLYNTWGCVFSVYPFPLWWLREYIYFVLLSSSNRKYELLPIV